MFWRELRGKGKVKRFMTFPLKPGLILLAFVTFGWLSLGFAQSAAPIPQPDPTVLWTNEGPSLPGSIQGTVVDQSGAFVVGARVTLTQDQTAHDQPASRESQSGVDGQFSFTNVPPGPFHLTITSAGFAPQTISGTLHSGEVATVSQITLNVAEARTEVRVGLSREELAEVAEEQIKVEEKQRVLGAIPNFYVSYIPNAAPLTPKQKFKLAWKTVIDPFTVVVVGGTAGIEQAQNHFAGYGQGAEGYGKRFGATYADVASGTFIGSAVLPSLLKQDPRYFYKGTGSVAARGLYALANSIICKGDNGHWQPNYSNVMGSLAAGGLSNLYYPEQDRNGAGLTLENAAIGIGTTAIGNLFQEFIVRKLTPKLSNRDSAKP